MNLGFVVHFALKTLDPELELNPTLVFKLGIKEIPNPSTWSGFRVVFRV